MTLRRADDTPPARLRHGVVLAPAGDGRWQARWDFDQVSFLEGAACASVLPWLAPMLAEGRDAATLRQAAESHGAQAVVEDVLALLRGEGLLEAGAAGAATGLRAAVAGLTASPDAALEAATRFPVTVAGRSPLTESIARALADEGIATVAPTRLDAAVSDMGRRRDPPARPPFVIAVSTDWPEPRLADLNHAALAAGASWMLVGAWNSRLVVGPIFIPGQTACLVCLRRRLDSHRRHLAAHAAAEEWLASRTVADIFPNDAPPGEPLLPSLASLAAGLTAHEVFCFATRVREPRTVGRVLIYRPDDAHLSLETVLRVPWCAECGATAAP